MEKSVPATSDAPAWVRWLLLLLIPLIALGLYLEGQTYDPGLVNLHGNADASEAVKLLPEALAGLPRTGPVRSFNKDSLYEYINGHADYFISGGFRLLAVGEYGADGAGQPRLVVNLYDMEQPIYAFGVMMGELNEDLQPLDLGSLGFLSGGESRFVDGRYYAQLSTFDEGVPLQQAAGELAQVLAERRHGIEPLDLRFPDLGRPLATHFVKEDYRGLDFLDKVLERRFQWQDRELAAFQLTVPPDEMAGLTKRLKGFLEEEGIEFTLSQHQGLAYYHVQDPYEGEWFFLPQDSRLLGVFAQPDAALLERIGAAEPRQ